MATAVLTRDVHDVEAYASALAPLSLDVVAMPLTKIASAPDPDALSRALDTGEYAAIVVASQRAAHELAKAVAQLASVRSTMPDLPDVWAVGPATKRVLEAAKLPAHQPPDVRDAAELARAIAAETELAGRRVLVPRAEDG